MKLTVTAFGVMAAAAALAAAKVEVSSLPPSQYADTEADTNTVVCSASVADNRFRLFLELDAMTNNCVMVEFGVDSDSNGALERNEIEFSVGWDCGEWIWRDSRGGMKDIYVGNANDRRSNEPLVEISPADKAKSSYLVDDWNGGCSGDGAGGARYYRYGLSMKEVVLRMLMNGVRRSNDNPRDITSGRIYGVYYIRGTGNRKEWSKGSVDVAFPWNSRNPIHR